MFLFLSVCKSLITPTKLESFERNVQVWGWENLVLLVSSCDKYSPCWDPFAHGLQKYWPDHPALYTITNHLFPNYGKVIRLGQDRGWAVNLSSALDQIDAPYILYAQEDYWLTHPVDNQVISDYLALLDNGQLGSLRLFPAPPPTGEVFQGDERLGIVPKGAEYRTSLQLTLWKKTLLQSLLVIDESPWAFELHGSRRSDALDDIFVCVRTKKNGIQYTFTAIVDGLWSPLAYEYARKENITIHFDQLPQKPFLVRQKIYLRRFLHQIKRRWLRFQR